MPNTARQKGPLNDMIFFNNFARVKFWADTQPQKKKKKKKKKLNISYALLLSGRFEKEAFGGRFDKDLSCERVVVGEQFTRLIPFEERTRTVIIRSFWKIFLKFFPKFFFFFFFRRSTFTGSHPHLSHPLKNGPQLQGDSSSSVLKGLCRHHSFLHSEKNAHRHPQGLRRGFNC
jgi:hypothetical protein